MYAHCKAEQESGGEVEDGKEVVDLGKQIQNQVALTSYELAPMFQSFTTFVVVPRPEEKAYLNYQHLHTLCPCKQSATCALKKQDPMIQHTHRVLWHYSTLSKSVLSQAHPQW